MHVRVCVCVFVCVFVCLWQSQEEITHSYFECSAAFDAL